MNIVYNTSGARWARGRTPHCASKRVWVKSTYHRFDTWLFHWSDAASAFQKNVGLPFGTHAKGNEEKPNRQLCILHYIVPFLFMPHIQYPISAPLATFLQTHPQLLYPRLTHPTIRNIAYDDTSNRWHASSRFWPKNSRLSTPAKTAQESVVRFSLPCPGHCWHSRHPTA